MADDTATPRKLWQHPSPKSTAMWKFMQSANQKRGLNMQTFRELYNWSVGESRTDFWEDMWNSSGLIYEGNYSKVVDTSKNMDSIPQWFEGTRLNFAENILYSASPLKPSQRTTEHKEDAKIALTEVREGNTEVRHLSLGELRRRVAVLANALRAKGVKKGDRVAVVASTSFDTFITFMAIVSLGGLFSSSSTDMGTKGILERLLQVKPAYVFIDDWTVYNGKTIDLRPKIKEIVEGMAGVIEFKEVVTQPRFTGKPASLEGVPRTVTFEEFVKAAQGNDEVTFDKKFNRWFKSYKKT